MGGIWAVLRHTLAHCLRMKIAAAFVIVLAIMLAVMLAAMPVVSKGDGTLGGRIKTFLAGSTDVTVLLLSAMTIFLSILVVTSDVQHKRIFIVASKPLPRWQYVLGRWAGVVVFDAVLLLCAGAAVYGFSRYLRVQPALNPDDRRVVETEIFTSRQRVHPAPPDVRGQVERRIARLKEEGRYASAIEAYKLQTGGDEAKAEQLLLQQVRTEAAAELQSVAVDGSLVWRFEGITLGKEDDVRGTGKVTDINLQAGLVRVAAGPHLLGRMVYDGPVSVNGVNAKVYRLGQDSFDAFFYPEDAKRLAIAALKPGSEAQLAVDPTIQVTYKAAAVAEPADGVLRSLWEVQNPTTGLFYQELRSDKARTPATLTLSSRLVAPDGRIELRYVNRPYGAGNEGTSVTILNDDVSVLYRVGGFEGNLARAGVLIFLQLMFLAAAGVFCGTFLSFPVACLVTLVALPLGMAMDFMTTATVLSPIEARPVMKHIGAFALAAVKVLVPDFSQTNPRDYLIEGTNIGWGYLGSTAAVTVALRGVVILAAACLVFSRRELARVQV